MKKHLERVHESLMANLFTVEMMIRSQEDPVRIRNLKLLLSDYYLLEREIDTIISRLKCMRDECISEINGNYFQEHSLPFLDEDEEPIYDPEVHNPYCSLKWDLDEKRYYLSQDLQFYIHEFHKLELQKAKTFMELVPDAIISNGEEQISPGEMMQGNITKDLQASMNILEGYDKMLIRLRELADSKGSLAEIMSLIE